MFTSDRSFKTWNARYADHEALASITNQGYLEGTIFSKSYLAHRVIWLLVTGDSPEFIDHVNGDRSDNRWNNLRIVTKQENNQNRAKPKSNKTGYIGVSYDATRGKYKAYIQHKGQQIHLGMFSSSEEASLAYEAMKQNLGFHLNHGRPMV